jgi:hypothetical protein
LRTRPRRTVTEAHNADVVVLGLVPADRVLAAPATLARTTVMGATALRVAPK